jgi:hypothetical protein
MTGRAFYTLLYNWVTLVVTDVPAIRAQQNAAKPVGTYIAIEDDVDWIPFGREGLEQDLTTSGVRTDYTVAPAFWEVSNGSGYGDSLRALRDSLGTVAVKKLFSDAGVGILHAGDIVSMPWTSTETQIFREKRMEIRFSVASKLLDAGGTPGAIVTVQTVNDPPFHL